MALIEERSPAKINLTLKILGKRPDGYHDLRSLVVFGHEASDIVTLDTSGDETLTVTGPFAAKLEGENILARTLARVHEAAKTRVPLGSVHLEKNIPVAAGLGGGSANAAALLRAIRRAHPHLDATLDWHALAVRLGADVAVCLESRASLMTGIGDLVTPIETAMPPMFAVLANPRVPVPHDKTARVFRALAAPPLDMSADRSQHGPLTFERLTPMIEEDGNDLTIPAASVIPEINDVLSALDALEGRTRAALSGAGPTGFALFPERTLAEHAARDLAALKPGWWVAATALR